MESSFSACFSQIFRRFGCALLAGLALGGCSQLGRCTFSPELLQQVSSARGLSFSSPAGCVRKSPAQARRDLRASILSSNSRRELEFEEQLLKALSFVPADYSLVDSVSKRASETASAYYDPKAKRIVVVSRTSKPSDNQLKIVSHELTHMLQDQHFSISSLIAKEVSSDQQRARTAILEGDANAVMMLVTGTLDCNYEWESVVRDFEKRKKEAVVFEEPPALAIMRGASYILGMRRVCKLLEEGGFEAVNNQIKDLPKSSKVLFDWPDASSEGCYREGEADSLGALAGFALLASKSNILPSIGAVRGWSSDCAVRRGSGGFVWTISFEESKQAAVFAQELRKVLSSDSARYRHLVTLGDNFSAQVKVEAYTR